MRFVFKGLIKVKPCNALLHMVLMCIHSYLKSVLMYKFLILDTCHLDTVYSGEPGCEDPWLFLEAKRSPRAKEFGKQCFKPFMIVFLLRRPNMYDLSTFTASFKNSMIAHVHDVSYRCVMWVSYRLWGNNTGFRIQ